MRDTVRASSGEHSAWRSSLDGMSDDTAELVGELELIEQQPLERRAEGLAALHDRLEAALAAS